MKQQILNHPDPTHGEKINYMFENKPPFPSPPGELYNPYAHLTPHHPPLPHPNPKTWAYYRHWEHYKPFVDTSQFSNACPGVTSGLYNPLGPLSLGQPQYRPTYLTNVKTECQFSLRVTFNYSVEEYNKSVDLTVGTIYNLTYLENGQIYNCTGKCSDIWKVYGTDNTVYYKIKFDCSVNYSNQVVIIKNDQIRGLSVYTGLESEDNEIENSEHSYGTTTGDIENVIITHAIMDSSGNFIDGNVINGNVKGYTCDGIAKGNNKKGTLVTTINSMTENGTIYGGKIISGLFLSGSVQGGRVDPQTGIKYDVEVRGKVIHAIVINSTIQGGYSKDGTLLNPEISNGVLYNAMITGSNLITTGGVTVGNITTGGLSIGGTATGGSAVGVIDGKVYTIENGTTQPESGKQLVTSGGIVTGGKIIGGVQEGNLIIGATIEGGVVTQGNTTNGVTTGGTLIPTPTNPLPISKAVLQNENERDLIPNTQKAAHPTESLLEYNLAHGGHNHDHLVIIHNSETGDTKTNFGKAVMQTVPFVNHPPDIHNHPFDKSKVIK